MSTFTCPHCNKPHLTEARFCPVTGKSIPVAGACENCGQSVQEDWNVCPSCGSWLVQKVDDGKKKPDQLVMGSKKNCSVILWSASGLLLVACLTFGGFGVWKIWERVSEQAASGQPALQALGESTSPQASPGKEEEGITFDPVIQPPIQSLPVLAGTSVPQPRVPISPDNAQQVVELANRQIGEMTVYSFSPDGKLLVIGTSEGVHLYHADTLKKISRLDWVSSAAFSSDGGTLASGSTNGIIHLWRVSGGGPLHTLKGHTSMVTTVAFSPDGRMLASGSTDGYIYLFRTSDGTYLWQLEEHFREVHNVAFSPDGTILASGTWDSFVRLWQVSNGSHLRKLKGHSGSVHSVAFSPDGTVLASGSNDRTICLHRVSDGELLRTMEGNTSKVNILAFSPDGQILISGSSDSTIWLWRVSDGSILRILEGHTRGISSINLSPDGTTITTASNDGTIRIWGVYP
jgi:WD40 repeat protein